MASLERTSQAKKNQWVAMREVNRVKITEVKEMIKARACSQESGVLTCYWGTYSARKNISNTVAKHEKRIPSGEPVIREHRASSCAFISPFCLYVAFVGSKEQGTYFKLKTCNSNSYNAR